MFGVFIGEHDNKIDTKGRLSIPADFRRELEDGDPKWEEGKNATMALVYGDHRRNYIEVFKIADFMSVHNNIRQMPPGTKSRYDLQKLFGHQTLIASVDETGRIVLTAKLREKLGLDGQALVVGNSETFMIWKPETYRSEGVPNLVEDEGYDANLDPSAYLPGSGGWAAGPGGPGS